MYFQGQEGLLMITQLRIYMYDVIPKVLNKLSMQTGFGSNSCINHIPARRQKGGAESEFESINTTRLII